MGGGTRSDLIADAVPYGRMTGTLVPAATALLPNNSAARFMNDRSVGFPYATESCLTVNLEYHFHEAGFSSREWSDWFNALPGHASIPGVNLALWYLRAYAQDQQEPMSRHAAFLRVDWRDAFVKDLELTALATLNLQDASAFSQATAEYHVPRAWTVAGFLSGTYGGRRSEYGGLLWVTSALLRASRYF